MLISIFVLLIMFLYPAFSDQPITIPRHAIYKKKREKKDFLMDPRDVAPRVLF